MKFVNKICGYLQCLSIYFHGSLHWLKKLISSLVWSLVWVRTSEVAPHSWGYSAEDWGSPGDTGQHFTLDTCQQGLYICLVNCLFCLFVSLSDWLSDTPQKPGISRRDHTHVFQPASYCCLQSQHFKYTWDLIRTCDQLVLISPYYITMKSTCFIQPNWVTLRISEGHHKQRLMIDHPYDVASSSILSSNYSSVFSEKMVITEKTSRLL